MKQENHCSKIFLIGITMLPSNALALCMTLYNVSINSKHHLPSRELDILKQDEVPFYDDTIAAD